MSARELSLGAELHWKVEQFLFREARLLDDRQFDAWIQLWCEDCRYRVPVRTVKTVQPNTGVMPVDEELVSESDVDWVDDDKMQLFARVMRLSSGKAWSENPMARTRRLVSNVELVATESPNSVSVISNQVQFRSRKQGEEAWFVTRRDDSLISIDDGFQIKSRTVLLDSAVLMSPYATFI